MQHNLKAHEQVYIRDARESGKPKWIKHLYSDHLVPLLEEVDPQYAGKHEDYAVQVTLYDSSKRDSCKEHADKDDIAPQLMMTLGDFTGGELAVTDSNGKCTNVDLKDRIVKLDARQTHKVLPFEGIRISVIWYKRYDRTMDAIAPIMIGTKQMYPLSKEPATENMELSSDDEKDEFEVNRDTLKQALTDHKDHEPRDVLSDDYKSWEKKHVEMAAKLVSSYGEFCDSAYLLMLYEVGVGALDVEKYLKQKWRDLESAWTKCGTDRYGNTLATRLYAYTGTPKHTLDSFSKYLAMAVHTKDLWRLLQVKRQDDDTKVMCDTLFHLLRPTPGFMRLNVGSDGQCEDVAKIPNVVLTEKGVVPFRRNGPVDVTGLYGREDCVLVAINGACGYPLLTRDDLSAIEPLFKSGGLSLYDDRLRDIVNKTPFTMQRRKKLSGNYQVFVETSGIYVVATKLICADGTEQLHAIYVDCERDIVHFGYNDYGDDMISFLIEKSDRRDVKSAEENLISPKNFPRNADNPGRSLVKIEIREVVQIMVKTKKIKSIPHVAYTFAASKRPLEETANASNKRARN